MVCALSYPHECHNHFSTTPCDFCPSIPEPSARSVSSEESSKPNLLSCVAQISSHQDLQKKLRGEKLQKCQSHPNSSGKQGNDSGKDMGMEQRTRSCRDIRKKQPKLKSIAGSRSAAQPGRRRHKVPLPALPSCFLPATSQLCISSPPSPNPDLKNIHANQKPP